MNQLLQKNEIVHTESSNLPCTVEEFLGGRGQGEVYRATLAGQPMALKWYFPAQATSKQRAALEILVQKGPPTDKFLWPLELASAAGVQGFGYLMPLREPRYKGIVDLMKRRIDPSFRALATAGLELADSFFQLHAKGLCYRTICFGNVFFDPNTGEVLIYVDDNVAVDGATEGSVLGTPRFMAPEMIRGEALPSVQTDLFSLGVLLFYMFMVHHPLEGRKETAIRCFDLHAMNKLYGSEPLFIFDPNDDSNRPVAGIHDSVLEFWPIYPPFLRDLFTKAFTDGIRDSQHGRVRETEWMRAMNRLHDAIIYCPSCGAENFYDIDTGRAHRKLSPCWSCKNEVPLPPQLRIGRKLVMLNHDTRLYPHHVDSGRSYDFTQPIAAVVQHPKNPNIWGIKNLSGEKWVATTPDGTVRDVPAGRSVTLAGGTKINFGKSEGEING